MKRRVYRGNAFERFEQRIDFAGRVVMHQAEAQESVRFEAEVLGDFEGITVAGPGKNLPARKILGHLLRRRIPRQVIEIVGHPLGEPIQIRARRGRENGAVRPSP